MRGILSCIALLALIVPIVSAQDPGPSESPPPTPAPEAAPAAPAQPEAPASPSGPEASQPAVPDDSQAREEVDEAQDAADAAVRGATQSGPGDPGSSPIDGPQYWLRTRLDPAELISACQAVSEPESGQPLADLVAGNPLYGSSADSERSGAVPARASNDDSAAAPSAVFGPVSTSGGLSLWMGTLALGTLIGMSVHRFGAPNRGAARPRSGVAVGPRAESPLPETSPPAPSGDVPERTADKLMREVRERPLDGEAHFLLGIQLLRQDDPKRALPHLARSFRLRPDLIVRLLEDESLRLVRDDPRVRVLLRAVQRENQQRVWSGYA